MDRRDGRAYPRTRDLLPPPRPVTCAHCVDAADFFGRRMARRELKRYRRKGPSGTTRTLVEGIREELAQPGDGTEAPGGLEGRSLLDVGGGVGAVQHELLAHGADRVIAVDASPAYLSAARAEAARRGTLGRVDFRLGDVVELAPELPETDAVTLDRVLCCYPDMPALVEVCAVRARRTLGVVIPRESWWVRAGVHLLNLVQRLRGKSFRVHLHGEDRILARIREHGLQRVRASRTLLWHVWVFRRGAGGA